MVGKAFWGTKALKATFGGAAIAGLVACDENGQFALPVGGESAGAVATPAPANAPNQRISSEQDIERPDIFEVSDRGLWDGRPSLGGVWVAHPDVGDPERVLIRNTENGETIIGALFRRERDNPGPALQVSSDAADALGVLAGAPTPLYVVALRRQEIEVIVPATEENPVVASLEAPVTVVAAPLESAPSAQEDVDAPPVATAPPVEEAAETAGAAATFAAAASLAAADSAASAAGASSAPQEAPIDVSAVFEAPTVPADGPLAQIGVFSVEANANQAAEQIQAAGFAAEVLAESMGGQTVWRVVAGPLPDAASVDALKGLGFVDAFILDATE